MEDYHWNIALVVISLLSLVLLITTAIVIACVKRENKRFYKRFAAKSSSQKQDDDIDVELRDLILKLSNCNDLQNKLNLRSSNINNRDFESFFLDWSCPITLNKWNIS